MKNKKTGLIVGVLITALLLGGCGVRFDKIKAATGDAEKLKTNIVKIVSKTNDGKVVQGSGFFDTKGHLIVTSNVVDTTEKTTVYYADGTFATAKLISNNIKNNTAVLKVEEPKVQAFEIGKAKLPKEGELDVAVIGFDKETNEPTIVETTGEIVASKDKKNAIIINTGLSDAYNGAVVLNEEDKVIGNIVLATDRLDYAIAQPMDELNQSVNKLSSKTKIEEFKDETRTNIYTDIANEKFGDDTSEFYVGDTCLYGSATTQNGAVLKVNQENSKLVTVLFDATKASQDEAVVFGGEAKTTVTAKTNVGDFTTVMNRTKINKGDEGEILLYFENLQGQITKLVFNNVSSEESTTIDIILKKKLTHSGMNAEVAAGYLEYLQNNKDLITSDIDAYYFTTKFRPIAFSDITGDKVPEMITVQKSDYGYLSYVMITYEEGSGKGPRVKKFGSYYSPIGTDAGRGLSALFKVKGSNSLFSYFNYENPVHGTQSITEFGYVDGNLTVINDNSYNGYVWPNAGPTDEQKKQSKQLAETFNSIKGNITETIIGFDDSLELASLIEDDSEFINEVNSKCNALYYDDAIAYLNSFIS